MLLYLYIGQFEPIIHSSKYNLNPKKTLYGILFIIGAVANAVVIVVLGNDY